MFLGENLPSWIVLALGAALAVGNAMALLVPREQDPDAASDLGEGAADLERPPLMRSLLMIALGSVAAIWAVASLLSN